MPRRIDFVIPGSLDTRTGGYHYDRRIVRGLERCGWRVQLHELDGSFPSPDTGALKQAVRTLAAIPDGRLVIVDGLAFGAMPEVVAEAASRLCLIALVHHPLALESGLSASEAVRLREAETAALAHAAQIIVTSPVTRETLADFAVSPSRVAVVRPGTDNAEFADSALRARGRGSDACDQALGQPSHASTESVVRTNNAAASATFLTVATLTPRKRHVMLINALARLASRNWRLVCVGSSDRDPQTTRAVMGAIRAAKLDGRVNLVGEVGDAELAAHYHAADVFVLASAYEGYGMVYDEALARGLPIIATDGGASAATVPVDAGLLIPGNDVVALSGALARWLDDRLFRARLYAGARKARAGLRHWDDAVRDTIDVLNGLRS